MVSKKEKNRMKEYVSARLENSGMKNIKDVDRDQVQVNTPYGSLIHVFLHTSPNGYENFLHGDKKFHNLVYNQEYVSNIFYKDGKNFFTTLDDDEKMILSSRSMKEYSYNQISKMIKLKKKESEVLRLSGIKKLTYYQPSNIDMGGRLEEGMVNFGFSPVFSSYSHYPIDKKGFDFVMADDGRRLISRALSTDKKILEGKLKFTRPNNSPHILLLSSCDNTKQNDINNRPAFCLENELIKDFLMQTGKTIEDFGGDVSEYINPD